MIEMAKESQNRDRGTAVDIETRRKKQQTLMVKLVERKVRSRAEQLYETRGHGDGQALQDWFQAESEVLGNTVLAPLYRRMRENLNADANSTTVDPSGESACETSA